MNFKINEGLENKQRKDHTINEAEETVFDLYMFLLGNFIIIIFGVWFHKKFYNIIPNEIFKLSIALVVVMPIILYSYYIFHEIESVREHKSYKVLLDNIFFTHLLLKFVVYCFLQDYQYHLHNLVGFLLHFLKLVDSVLHHLDLKKFYFCLLH